MRVAAPDIHGTTRSGRSSRRDRRRSPDEIWCLRDLVGYGPRPNRCCRRVAARAAISLVGNHDLGALGELSLEMFSPDAAAAARWTDNVLEPDAREYLSGLAPALRRKDAELYHASPRDPIWDYVLTEDAVIESLAPRRAAVLRGTRTAARPDVRERIHQGPSRRQERTRSRGDARLLNPGSVDSRATATRGAWLLVGSARARRRSRRQEYPIELTQEEILARGLPESLASGSRSVSSSERGRCRRPRRRGPRAQWPARFAAR
jgi:hypothetical protein